MSEYFAGIDGGQSSTVAIVGDEDGKILGRATAGPADEVGGGADSTRLRDALGEALAGACRAAGLPYESTFAAVVAGVSGYEGRVFGRPPKLPAQRLVMLHDAPIAHAGALGGQPGVVVIAGTGSVVHARDDDGTTQTLGGWGFVFGDEGSAFAIARDALAALMRAEDVGDPLLIAQARATYAFFERGSLREVARAFYTGELTRDRIAAYAATALRFGPFRSLADAGADRLGMLACTALRSMRARAVALTGGVFDDAAMRARAADAIVAQITDAQIIEPKYEPAAGALLLAYRELGLPVAELSR